MPTEIDRILGRIANILRQDKEMLLMGYGHLEPEIMGGLPMFRRLARPLAEREGVKFDERQDVETR